MKEDIAGKALQALQALLREIKEKLKNTLQEKHCEYCKEKSKMALQGKHCKEKKKKARKKS